MIADTLLFLEEYEKALEFGRFYLGMAIFQQERSLEINIQVFDLLLDATDADQDLVEVQRAHNLMARAHLLYVQKLKNIEKQKRSLLLAKEHLDKSEKKIFILCIRAKKIHKKVYLLSAETSMNTEQYSNPRGFQIMWCI